MFYGGGGGAKGTGGKRHGGQKTGGQKAGGQKAWGAKGRGAKGRGAKHWGAKDRGAKVLVPNYGEGRGGYKTRVGGGGVSEVLPGPKNGGGGAEKV